MRILLLYIFFALLSKSIFSAALYVDVKSDAQTREIIGREELNNFELLSYVHKTYHYSDATGEHYFILTENAPKAGHATKIKAVDVLVNDNKFFKNVELSEEIERGSEGEIYFWTKYSYFYDLTNEGIITPVIVYGTNGLDATNQGRIMVVAYYRNKKCEIEIFESDLDEGRGFLVDRDFYALPGSIRKSIIDIIAKIEYDGNGYFPCNWRRAIEKNKTDIEAIGCSNY